MIKIENTEVMNFEGALRGMRNPMNSWDKSDSKWNCVNRTEDFLCTGECEDCEIYGYEIGEADLKLAQNLIKAGSDHRKFMRQIFVSVDITAPLYWWKEFDTYKVGTVANSCSMMHKIQDKEFTLNDFSHEHLIVDEDMTYYYSEWISPKLLLRIIINTLNGARELYLKTKDKKYWWQMIQLLPSSYNQRRTVTMNYENALNMYHARKNHKLDEWHVFCDWIETLPYFKEICLSEDKEND